MKAKARVVFYEITTMIALGFMLSILTFFSVKIEMMLSLQLIMAIMLGFGILLGVAYNKIFSRYSYFAIVGATFLIALITGRLANFLYVIKEVFAINIPARQITLPFVLFVLIISVINLYIVLTQHDYQKFYTREERRARSEKSRELSEYREEKTAEEIAKNKKIRRIQQVIVITVLGLFFLVYGINTTFRDNLNHAFDTISKLDTNIVIEYIRSFGPMAAVVSFILMILQSIAAPIPAFLITLSNAAIFGWVKGAILSWSSAMAGAALCFFIARALGRDAVEKLTSRGAMKSVDVFFERYGNYTILICRLLPFVSFDFVSYGAGLTNMSFWSFFVATGVGQLPATIIYSFVGGTLTGGAKKLFMGLLVLFALSIAIGIAKRVHDDKYKGITEENL